MGAMQSIFLGLSILLPREKEPEAMPDPADCARLREMLQDRQHPRIQSQAALLLMQSQAPEAATIIRQGLEQIDSPEVFQALASALQFRPTRRFNTELLGALSQGRPAVRQSAAEALALLADDQIVSNLQALAENPKADLAVRQAAVMTLGRSGCRKAAAVLLDVLACEQEGIRRAAADALEDLTGQSFGSDRSAWHSWWLGHKDLSTKEWLEERLVYQASRAHRLEGELDKTRSQLLRLYQQFYARLPAADRLGQVQALSEQEDPALRGLAVTWSVELLPAADALARRSLTDSLLRLSHDAAVDVQRPAVLALGQIIDARSHDRLEELLQQSSPAVRAAAARALTQQTMKVWENEKAREAAGAPAPALLPVSTSPPFTLTRAQVVPALQKALEDPALEVVIEAAEDLGALGVPEAGPVLAALLSHSSETVRQTAAQALERVADLTVLDGLLAALEDPAVTVRFSAIGALGHAIGDGKSLSDSRRDQLRKRLEKLLVHDPDPGVRSRAGTVLGEFASPDVLPVLWQRVLATEDSRVQDKAWAAVMKIVIRSGTLDLLYEWDHRLAEAKQGVRRLQLLGMVCESWKKFESTRNQAGQATEVLIQAQLEEGKWETAFPLVRDLLTQPGSEAEMDRRLHWLWAVGEQALQEGKPEEALRVVREAQPFLARDNKMSGVFENLEKQAHEPR